MNGSMIKAIADTGKDLWNGIHHDGGPIYTETDFSSFIVEPWNALSALLFMLLPLYWIFRLKGKYSRYAFLTSSMIILLLGGLGGALYHGFRANIIFMWMDVGPIFFLALASTVYLWFRVVPHWLWLLPILPSFFVVDLYVIPNMNLSEQAQDSFEYINMSMMLILPLVAVLFKTRFRYVGFILIALGCFLTALAFRVADSFETPILSMGTHWLWHVLGSLACFAFAEYIYRLTKLKNAAERILRLQI